MLRVRPDPPSVAGNPLPGDPDGRCEADVLIVAGDPTPGLVVISKAGIPYKWDKRSGYGYGGAWLVFTGDDLSEFDTTFTIWRNDQKVAWDVWKKKYLTKPPVQPQTNGAFTPNIPKPKALGVANPILSELAIKQIVPKHIGQWVKAGPNKWTKTVQWYQFRLPVPLLGRPSAAIDDAKKKSPTADDAVQLQLRSALQDVKARQARVRALQGLPATP